MVTAYLHPVCCQDAPAAAIVGILCRQRAWYTAWLAFATHAHGSSASWQVLQVPHAQVDTGRVQPVGGVFNQNSAGAHSNNGCGGGCHWLRMLLLLG